MIARQPGELMDVPETAWQEACRREAVVRPMATKARLSREAVTDARLRLGKTQVYELMRRYRTDPRTTSLVPSASGTPKGADRLAPEIAAIIQQCIEQFYLTRPKLTGAALFDAIEPNAARLVPGRPA
jgi:putative transposase